MSGLDLDYLFKQIKDSVDIIVGKKVSVYDAMKEYQAYIDRLNAKIDNLPKSVPEPLRIGILGEYNALVDLSISLRNRIAGDDEAFNNFTKAFSNELIKQGYISKPLTREEAYPYWGRFFIKPLENICEKLTKRGIVRSGMCAGATQHLAGYEPLILGEVDYYTFEQISEIAELGLDPFTITMGTLAVITITAGAVLITKYLSAKELKDLETIKQMDKLNDELLSIQKSNLPKEEKDKRIAEIRKSIEDLSKVASSGGSGISFNPLWLALMVAIGFAGYKVYKKFKG
jgi:hypothetical protein